MADIPTVKLYKERIKALLDVIVFDSSTLGAKNIIKLYLNDTLSKPDTEINIFEKNISTEYLESKLNSRYHFVTIRIRARAENRNQQAQDILEYLSEQITDKLEKATSDATWGDGYMQWKFNSIDNKYSEGYYVRDITIPIVRRVIT
jgi:hypothetical protein